MNWIPKIAYTELNTGISKEIIFDSPPEGDPFGEQYSHKIIKTISSDGTSQVQYNYGEKLFDLEFLFQSEAVKDQLIDFFNNHAIKGGKFDYYPSSDEADYTTFEIDQKKLRLSRPIPSAVEGEFEYDVKLQFRAVI